MDIFEHLYDILYFVEKRTRDILNYIYNIDYSTHLQTACIRGVMRYSRLYNNTREIVMNIYESHPYIQNKVDEIYYAVKYTYFMCINKQVEPLNPTWLSNSYIDRFWKYHEEYIFYTDEMKPDIFSLENSLSKIIGWYYQFLCKKNKSNQINLENSINTLVMMKYTDENKNTNYLIKKLSEHFTKLDTTKLNCEKSNVSFISVNYFHPKMTNLISLNIDKSMLLTQNDLFTPTFVRRWLEYQDEHFIFDMDYLIKIIDSNINMIELNSKQYIQIQKDDYIIESTVVPDNSGNHL